MKWEKRKADICEECASRDVCGFYLSQEHLMCEWLEHVKKGWEMGREDAIDEVETYVDQGNSAFTSEFMDGLMDSMGLTK